MITDPKERATVTLNLLKVFGKLWKKKKAKALKLFSALDRENQTLKGTGLRIVFIPADDECGQYLRPMVWEFGISSNPPKHHDYATMKAFGALTSGDFSAVFRERKGEERIPAGGIMLSNMSGALGASGLLEPDDHFALAASMKATRLLTSSRARDENSEVLPDYPRVFTAAAESNLVYEHERVNQIETLFGLKQSEPYAQSSY